ncbi:MAG: S9 family peptidase [Acidobacteria bacterium]|nr:S9 family peptidase [Acidobacteriota bacterium]
MRVIAGFLLFAAGLAQAQPSAAASTAAAGEHDHGQDEILRQNDTTKWRHLLGGVADIDEVAYTSLPPTRQPNPTGQGAANPVIVHAMTFIPKRLDRAGARRHPLLVHGGVHSNFNTSSAHIVAELVEQGYSVIAPDYRGSTGYGRHFYELIDYGGRENDDVWAARNWMLENCGFLDPARVGILGWSHGGMITLMNLFEHPEAYAVAYAGVPVSDLVARMGYKTESYRRLFSASYHIGKTAEENVNEYLRRSPVTHAHKLVTPLLIHTNTSDEDVNVLEVRRLIAALQAAGRKFEYKIYENAPGGHTFNRIDTKLACESRKEIWSFLGGILKPVAPSAGSAARASICP